MAQTRFFVSATIVLIFFCGVVEASPQDGTVVIEPAADQADVTPLDDNMAVTPAPALKNKSGLPDPRYYPYRQQLTFRTGYDSEYPKIAVDNWVLGFQYLFPKFLAPKLEAGADLIEGGSGHLHAGMRWMAWEKSYFRPSVKVGLDHLADGKEGLATLTDWEHYFIRGSACLEYVVWNPFSLRLEHEILANFDKMRAVLTLGISHGW